jgi:CRP/FNR family transcriptional regulator, cyclic AMP receptor protein
MGLSTQVVRKLVQVPIFGGLTVSEASEFFEVAIVLDEPQGKVLFREGDEGDALLVLLEGEVSVSRKGVELARLGQHAVLGEMSLLADKEARSATATVTQDVKLLKLPSRRLQKLLHADHVATLKVVTNLARVMSKRLAAVNEKLVASLGEKSAKREELADFSRILNRWDF